MSATPRRIAMAAALLCLLPAIAAAQNGTITGTIKNSAQAVLPKVQVFVYKAGPLLETIAQTDVNGVFTATLPAGTYYLATAEATIYVNEIHSDIPCFGACGSLATVGQGAPVVVASGGKVTVDFNLETGGSVTGTVTGEGLGALPNMAVRITVNGFAYVQAIADLSGAFELKQLPAGSYFLYTLDASGDWIDEVFDNVQCLGACDPDEITTGHSLAVTLGIPVTGKNIELAEAGRIRGTVTDGVNPISSRSVIAYSPAGFPLTSAVTDVDGKYDIGGLKTASYYVATQGPGPLLNEVWDNRPCIGTSCGGQFQAGTLVAVTAGTPVEGRNFALGTGRSISGSVIGNGGPGLASLALAVIPEVGLLSDTTITDGTGAFTADQLIPGKYYLQTQDPSGDWVNEIYDNQQCQGLCSSPPSGPNVALVDVTSANASGINFDLAVAGRISGTVTNSAGTPAPLPMFALAAFTAAGDLARMALTNNAGQYEFGGLIPGSYRVATSGFSTTYANEVWDDQGAIICGTFCTASQIASGDLISAPSGVPATGKDFSLQEFARISGTVTLEGSSAPVANATMAALAAADMQTVIVAQTNASGQYEIPGLMPGTYFLVVVSASGAIPEVYDNLQCVTVTTCDSAFIEANGTPIALAFGQNASGKNFALEPLTTISGTVTRLDNGQPLEDVLVYVTNPSGGVPISATTNASGVYSHSVRAGTYYLFTFNQDGYFDEAYDNKRCPSSFCDDGFVLANGTPVVVTTAPRTDVDFVLSRGAVISGTVTGSDAPAGVPDITVYAIDPSGMLAAVADTSSTGAYSITGLEAGTYYLYTFNLSSYFNEVFDNIPCPLGCYPSLALQEGTPIIVAADGTATANFTLQKGASISGTILSEAGGAPLEDAEVTVVRDDGDEIGYAFADSSGAFTTEALSPGTYYLYAGAPGHLAEYYDNVPCGGICQSDVAILTGTPIVVPAGAAITGRNFTLGIAGRITGTVTSGGVPVEDEEIGAFAADGTQVAYAFTDETGAYELDGLPAGLYRAATIASGNFINEVWDDISCSGECDPGEIVRGTPIAVVAGEATAGRDFVLAAGARFTGTVTGPTGAPIPDVAVWALAEDGSEYQGYSDEDGDYEIDGLPAGVYVLMTFGAEDEGHVNEVHDNVACPQIHCSSGFALQAGAKLTMALGATTTVNFVLAEGGRITGTITDAGTGAPLANVDVQATRVAGDEFDTTGRFTTDSAGAYSITGLPAGTWHVFTDNYDGYYNEIHPDLPCRGECDGVLALAGTPIAVAAGAATPGIDFALAPGGRIGGRVIDAVTSAGIADMLVAIFDRRGSYMNEVVTDASGDYISGAGLPTGEYFVTVYGSFDGHTAEIFDDLPCAAACSERAIEGTPIPVTSGATTAGRDFALERGGRFSGRVTHATSGLGLEDVAVDIYDAQGHYIDTVYSLADGSYITAPGLPAGAYYAATDSYAYLADEIYDNRPCAGRCWQGNITAGAPITVSAGVSTTGIDFALADGSGPPAAPVNLAAATVGGGIVFTWNADDTGAPPSSYLLEAGFARGAAAITIPVSGTSYSVPTVPPGRYFVRVRGVNGAGAGAASSEIAITVGGAGLLAPAAPYAPSSLVVGRRLMVAWETSTEAGPASGFVLEAGSASGLTDIASVAVSGQVFTYEPVPDGVYFLRVRARNAAGVSAPSEEHMLVVGAVPSPPDAPMDLEAAVAGSTVTLSWFAPAGPVTGYIVEAGSAPDLTDLALAPMGPATSATFTGIPPGRYYVRLRAVNARGRSTTSIEVTLVVP